MLNRLIFTILLVFIVTTSQAENSIKAGVGHSVKKDLLEAGKEAAGIAKGKLGDNSPKIAIVFSSQTQLTDKLIEGISQFIPKDKIIGAETVSPLVTETNFMETGFGKDHANSLAGVAVLMIGGDISINTTFEPLLGPADPASLAKNGEAMGARLKEHVKKEKTSNILFTFGYQPVKADSNGKFVAALLKGIGTDLPVLGGSSGFKPATRHIVYNGEILPGGNIALLINGDFKVESSVESGTGIEEAEKALKAVVGDTKPAFIMVTNCCGRRAKMRKAKVLDKELTTIQSIVGSTQVFGFYGSGEIGCKQGEASKGVGYSFCTFAIYP
jgi:hypothetical protein